jgi:4-hydroxythreonine-4-phosphate dehydrogenase
MYRPLIGVSVGDPAGIGPEITAKALSLSEIYELCRPLVIVEAEMMREAVKFSGLNQQIHAISSPREGLYQLGVLDVLDMKNIDGKSIRHKVISAEYGSIV